MLPFDPKDTATQKARYPAAVAEVFDVEAIQFSGGRRPGECPECVFDWADGLRVIVSRERLPDGEVVIHWSASPRQGSELASLLAECGGPGAVLGFLSTAESRFAELSGRTDYEFAGFSETAKRIPHWFMPEKPL